MGTEVAMGGIMDRTARTRFAILAALILALAIPVGASATSYPRTMASTGDSITRGYNTGFFPYTDNTAGSWSTGTDSRVLSHRLRLQALSPQGRPAAFNDARSGAKMADLNGQMAAAVSQNAQYVTVLMGANDVCTSSESSMTTVTNFTAQFTTAMNTITTGAPSAVVYVVSIPDIHHLWEIYKDSFLARTVWDTFDVCQSMLANPGSTLQADVDRRARVSRRNADFNAALESVCAAYRQCHFDGYAVFETQFARSDVSSRDYFHPSIAGQAKLASVTWAEGPYAP
jgi:lysophospholipase L1-like esterase